MDMIVRMRLPPSFAVANFGGQVGEKVEI